MIWLGLSKYSAGSFDAQPKLTGGLHGAVEIEGTTEVIDIPREHLPVVCHITTSHTVNDVRIYERECRSIAGTGAYQVLIVGPGKLPTNSEIVHRGMADTPEGQLQRLASGPWRAARSLRNVKADLYHFHDPELLPLAWWMAKRGRCVVWDAHEDYPARFTPETNSFVSDTLRSSMRALTRSVMAATDRQSAGVVAATVTIADTYANPNTVVVGNEARVDDFRDATPQWNTRRVLFTGTPDPDHLFPQVVEAVQGIPGLSMAVGRKTIDPDMRALATRALGSRFEFLGFLNRKALLSEISKCSVGLCTYAPTSNYLDPTVSPTKFYEFAAAGLPVVGSPIPTITSLTARSGGGLVSSDFTARSLSEALTSILASESGWQEMSHSGRAWSESQDGWRASEAKLLELYKQLLG